MDPLHQFRQYYSRWYSPEEWEKLERVLISPPAKVAHYFPHCGKSYLLDRASLEPVRLLAPKSGEKILDLCAAPGGKALLTAEAMGFRGELYCNDVSKTRWHRLKKVFREYQVPEAGDHWFRR